VTHGDDEIGSGLRPCGRGRLNVRAIVSWKATIHTRMFRELNAVQIRTTYGAVADLIGGIAQSIGARLGGLEGQRKEASWVVNAKTGLPTGYPPEHLHPALLKNSDIIATGDELWLIPSRNRRRR
jgi:hypothetical protein